MQLKNRISGPLMEAGVSYNKQKLHKVGYFRELLKSNLDIDVRIYKCSQASSAEESLKCCAALLAVSTEA